MSSEALHLLALPTEIRLRIYELAYDAYFIKDKLIWPNGYTFRLHKALHRGGTPWTLLRVCRQLHNEIIDMLPTISSMLFHFIDISEADMHTWLSSMSATQVSQMRRFLFSCHGDCQQLRDERRCERGLSVNLANFERGFPSDKMRFERTMQRASGASRYNRQFYKGFYLLRVREDCVVIPKAASHPRGSIGQCNSVVDQQYALANFISDSGEVRVGREAVMELLRAIMRDEIPGGPGTGRRWPAPT